MKLKLTIALVILFTQFIHSQDFNFFEPKVTIGGYGELHYNNEKIGDAPSNAIWDFHRFVLFFGYSWSEKWSFKSEVEFEHNFVKNGQGELALEQAYVNYHHSDEFGFNIGVILPSIGLINEYHEPPLFFGTERPVYHNLIIPTTWFGSGASVYGNVKGFDYRVMIFETLNSDKFSLSQGIRGGRMKGYKTDASRLLYSIRLDYLNIPGLKIGGSFSFNNAKGDSTQVDVTIAEIHAKYTANNITAVFEFGNISYNNGELKASRGYYFDLGYNVASFFDLNTKITPFIRYSDINTAAKTISGGENEKRYHFTEWMIGLDVKPIDNVVFKVDYSEQTRKLDDRKSKFINFGVGYMF
ncbi:porin [Ignavibacterium sp.]|uniref:porin n=1 Tax=Ignavibacterium sp. TaxID=2651167 RepID=UPI00307D52D9